MAINITTDGLVDALERLEEDGAAYNARLIEWIGHFSVEQLRSAGSLVNVLTGRMRHGFTWAAETVSRSRLLPFARLVIGNTARSKRGFPYPVLIELRFRGAERTLRARGSAILTAAHDHALDGREAPRGFRQTAR